MPLETCLQAVSEQSEKLHVKPRNGAAQPVQEGYTLSDSLREHPASLTPCFVRWSLPEKSGHLDVVLNRGGLHRTAAASEITPAAGHALSAGSAGGGNGRSHYFADGSGAEIIEQFDHLGHARYPPPRMLIAMSDALQASGVYWLAVCWGFWCWGNGYSKNPAMRLRWDKTLLRLPVTGRVARGLNTARFFPHVKHPHRQQCSAVGRHSDRRRRVGKSLCRVTTAAGGRSRPRRKQPARRAGGSAPVSTDDAARSPPANRAASWKPCLNRPRSTGTGI